MTEFQPILATLRRHKLIAGLLALLVALTCAIVCNVAFMIQQHSALMNIPSGVAENQLVILDSINLDRNADQVARHQSDLAALQMIPGVESVAAVDALPFNQNDWTNSIVVGPDIPKVITAHALMSAFNGTPGELKTLGLQLVAGRDFRPDEYIPEGSAHDYDGLDKAPTAIITRALAERLFHGESALGKTIYTTPNPIRVVGVVANLVRPNVGTGTDNDFSVMLPMLPDTSDVTYVLRTRPQERERVLEQAKSVLYRLDGNRVLRNDMTFQQLRNRYFQRDRTMISLLVASALGLLFVAALGITGLANFWVQQRTRTIGIRRALGATRGNILHYFQTENFLIVTLGVVLGVLLAVGLNLLLMQHYELPRLPLWYLPVGAIALWILGQLAVLAPALRASRVPPVVATRSV
ncbi:MAG: ABC transporter, permease protein [Rhodanobacteraceae bacterium]|jgi:putative ABC transport system permease protein|nr:MAG: ABC transporter, permease protein [Rhodanobacteraceae bacterium]